MADEQKEKKGSLGPIFFVMAFSVLIAVLWNQIPIIKDSVGAVLNPTLGFLLKWNVDFGAVIIILFITLITTLIQKYATDQKALKELKEEQKKLQEEMKQHRDNPQKMSELSKKQMEFFPKTFRLTSRSVVYTGVPLILFYRWFSDVFTALGNPLIFGFFSWFVFYILSAMVFSMILRKVMNIA
ncbi:MAG TPA: EMC3/TMCO1 family protein [Patescibacteria group bacterium]|nr:EMC3/TMCO1 family protein [Patescibacteria group bacterium]